MHQRFLLHHRLLLLRRQLLLLLLDRRGAVTHHYFEECIGIFVNSMIDFDVTQNLRSQVSLSRAYSAPKRLHGTNDDAVVVDRADVVAVDNW